MFLQMHPCVTPGTTLLTVYSTSLTQLANAVLENPFLQHTSLNQTVSQDKFKHFNGDKHDEFQKEP